MSPDTASSRSTPTPNLSNSFDPFAWLSQHPRVAVGVGAICLWISISLIIRLWIVHSKVSMLKKLTWSCILLIPFFGWIAYAGFFNASESTDIPSHYSTDYDHSAGGSGGND
jgi:uncharacterized membrane protein (DUF106 family)